MAARVRAFSISSWFALLRCALIRVGGAGAPRLGVGGTRKTRTEQWIACVYYTAIFPGAQVNDLLPGLASAPQIQVYLPQFWNPIQFMI
jgi:hypothetical protein